MLHAETLLIMHEFDCFWLHEKGEIALSPRRNLCLRLFRPTTKIVVACVYPSVLFPGVEPNCLAFNA